MCARGSGGVSLPTGSGYPIVLWDSGRATGRGNTVLWCIDLGAYCTYCGSYTAIFRCALTPTVLYRVRRAGL